jgi:GAF domain-containing protein
MQRISGAEIVSLYLFDSETQEYYAPVASGLPESGLLGSISDLRDQLARYRADAAQGKAPGPDALHLKHYGPNVWLTVTRRRLLARDAESEIASTFIRRHNIQTVVGLPLIAGDALVGLLYLDFCIRPGEEKTPAARPDAELLALLEREAAQAAHTIERARDAEERVAFAAIGKLAGQLSTPGLNGTMPDGYAVRGHLGAALAQVLVATGFEAAAIYQPGIQRGRLELVSEHGLPNPPPILDISEELAAAMASGAVGSGATDEAAQRGLAATGFHPVAVYPLRVDDRLYGYLIILSKDRLAFARKAPFIARMLQTTAELIAGALASQRLVTTLEDTNRVLGALSRMSTILLQPGATRQQVLEAIVQHLTDTRVPEFDFQLATVYLLDESTASPDRLGDSPPPLLVRLAAGAATAESIDSTPVGNGQSQQRVPRWVQVSNRQLSPRDILTYVAQNWQIVVVGAVPADGRDDGIGELALRYRPDEIQRSTVPALRSDGSTVALVPTILIGSATASLNGNGVARDSAAAIPFTLDGDLFESSHHGNLVRVFVPFGLDTQNRAVGVLEAGYLREHKSQLDRTPIEALRACVAQVAVAVETARLYEEVKRHAEQLEITTDVSKAIASSIDLDQTLRLVARNLARLIDASLCQIALYEEDGSAWYGAAASDEEEVWRRMRGERPVASFLFDVLDRRAPLVIEDALGSEQINPYYARLFGIRSLLALPLIADEQPIGVVVLAQRDRVRSFTAEEVQRTFGLAHQAAIAIKNARLHAFSEEERHIQKDFVLLGYGQWAQRAYQHLLTLKQFINFKIHVVAPDRGEEKRKAYAERVSQVIANGDVFYWDSPATPAHDQLRRALESSCYVITYVVTPAATHLPVVAQYYDLSNVIVIEKPLGAPLEAYREFLDTVDGSVELVAADHYYFKLEVRLLQVLLTEEKTLKTFLDTVEEIEIELLEQQPLVGAAAEIGIIADMIPHAFAIISLLTPIDRIQLAPDTTPLAIGRQEPFEGDKETYVRLTASFPHQGRMVRLVIVAGKGVENSKWIKLSGERRVGGRRSFYKFDFIKGEAIDGTQTNLRAAVRPIREAGVPDMAHLTMLRHVIEKRHPGVGILAIREAMRSNQRVQELQALAAELLARGEWTAYQQGQRPDFPSVRALRLPGEAELVGSAVTQAG